MDSPSFLILHGIENLQPPEHWHHWLTTRLRERGCEVRYPALPEPFEPELARWRETALAQLAELSGERVVVCHSLSCLLWLRIAAEAGNTEVVDRLLLVSPPEDEALPESGNEFRLGTFDLRAVSGGVRSAPRVVRGTQDPYSPSGPPVWIPAVGAELDEIPGAGHITPDDGHGPWPAVERWCFDPGVRIA
jgi:predicted alpha/beta hydrolase family esterase